MDLKTWLSSDTLHGYLVLSKTLPTPSVVAFPSKVRSSVIPNYNLIGNEDERNIRSNLIGHEDDSIEGLYPPKPSAHDHYHLESGKSVPEPENQYVVEISRHLVKFQTTGFPAQKIILSDKESEGIQKLSLAFVKLLNNSKLASETGEKNGDDTPDWRSLNPVITLSGSDISVQFSSKAESAEGITDHESNDKHILWGFMTKYAKNIFEEKLKVLNITEKHDLVEILPLGEVDDSNTFQKFLNTLWSIMRLSMTHAESTFDGWTTSTTTTASTTTEAEERPKSTIATLFAYEEPSPMHVFPSEEFEKRRRDIDSIYYGRGII